MGRAITHAMIGMFGPAKAGVIVAEGDGVVRLVSAEGYAEDEVARIREALAAGSGLLRRVLDGEELWSDDPGREEFVGRLELYEGRAGFTVPIVTPSGIAGTLTGIYRETRLFDEGFRTAARSLAAQAGLALSLIASREDVAGAAAESARRHRQSAALLAVSARLAGLTDLAAIPGALVGAIRMAGGSRSSSVGRRLSDGSGFSVIATSGLAPEQEAFTRDRVLLPEPGSGTADLLAGRPTVQIPPAPAILTASGLGVAVGAPVILDDEVWGFVALADPDPAFPADDLVEVVTGIAAIAAGAIARSMAVAELDRQRRRSERLFELSSVLADVEDPDRIPDVVCDVVIRASGAPYAIVARRQRGGDHFAIAATSGLSRAQIARIEQALAIVDRASLRQILDRGVASRSADSEVLADLGLAYAMGAPIVIAGESDGFIAIGSPPGEAVVEAEWYELLTAFAALTATALGRAEAVRALADQRDVLASEVAEQTRSLRAAVVELRRANEAKSEFLANVSHELRTPLTAILGFTEVLGAEFDGPLNAVQRRDLETIQASSQHLLEIIDDLIDIASIESGRIDIVLAPVDPTALVRDAVATIRPLAGARGIALEIDVPGNGSTPASVAADESRLREILLNLLSNAVKFTPTGGRVRVSLAADAETPAVRITVQDSGIGIATDDHERIFEKFTRIAGPDVPGTGLGLAISRELARLHRGDLTVESTPGLGSAFTVRIPVAGE